MAAPVNDTAVRLARTYRHEEEENAEEYRRVRYEQLCWAFAPDDDENR
jgi:hypothetical protein